MFLKDSKGQKSGSFTFAFVAFVITSVSVILSMIEQFTAGSVSFTFRSMDAAIITAYMVPILGLYFGRRFTESKFGNGKSENPSDPTA